MGIDPRNINLNKVPTIWMNLLCGIRLALLANGLIGQLNSVYLKKSLYRVGFLIAVVLQSSGDPLLSCMDILLIKLHSVVEHFKLT